MKKLSLSKRMFSDYRGNVLTFLTQIDLCTGKSFRLTICSISTQTSQVDISMLNLLWFKSPWRLWVFCAINLIYVFCCQTVIYLSPTEPQGWISRKYLSLSFELSHWSEQFDWIRIWLNSKLLEYYEVGFLTNQTAQINYENIEVYVLKLDWILNQSNCSDQWLKPKRRL